MDSELVKGRVSDDTSASLLMMRLQLSPAMPRAPILILAFLALFCLNGCSKAPPELVSVHGKVTVNGNPVPRIGVIFVPTDENQLAARGTANERGEYALRHRSGELGSEVGHYKVIFRAFATAWRKDAGLEKSLLYDDPQTTPYEADVPPEGGEFNFDLRSP